jgi:hypothetical protein
MDEYLGHVTIIRDGISFGAALAMTISFTKNRSILWAIIAGVFGWFYVIYAALAGGYSK